MATLANPLCHGSPDFRTERAKDIQRVKIASYQHKWPHVLHAARNKEAPMTKSRKTKHEKSLEQSTNSARPNAPNADSNQAQELEEDPWRRVSAADIQARLDAAFLRSRQLAVGSGRVLLPRRKISIRKVLVDVVSRSKEERKRNREKLWDWGEEFLLSRCTQDKPSWLVKCSNPNSMVSGIWGLRKFTMGCRGYVYFDPGDDDLGEEYNSLPIFSAWEPIENRAAFEACFLATYERKWDKVCLPPMLGECAAGPSALIRQAMFNILKAKPSAWDRVLETLVRAIESQRFTSTVLKEIGDEIRIPYNSLVSALRQVSETHPKHLGADERETVIAVFWKCIEWDPFGPD
jgi:hypothetical protein